MIALAGAIVAIVVLAITLKYVKDTRKIKGRKPIPKPPGLPFIGQALQMNASTIIYKLDEFAQRYGEIYQLTLMGKTVVVLNSMPLMRKAYCSDQYSKYFNDIGNSFFSKYCRNGGESVAIANDASGYKYKAMKKTYIKALHTYGTGVKDLEDKVLIEMRNIQRKLHNMKPKEFDFVSFIKRSLSNVISIIVVYTSYIPILVTAVLIVEYNYKDNEKSDREGSTPQKQPSTEINNNASERENKTFNQVSQSAERDLINALAETDTECIFTIAFSRGMMVKKLNKRLQRQNGFSFVFGGRFLVGESIPEGDPDENLFWQSIEFGELLASQHADSVLSALPFLRLIPGLKYGNMFLGYMAVHDRLVEKYFNSVRAVHQAGDEQGIVQFYLEQQRKEKLTKGNDIFLTDDIIVAQMHETIDAGIATTWSLVTSSMLILLHHPECQIKIQEEIDRVIGRDGVPSFADRTQCPFIMAFEKEVHRYATVFPLLIPHTCNENVEFEGYGIGKEHMVLANTWFVHHDARIWGDPWNFRPERFLDEGGKLLPSEHILCRSVLAFGLGDRRCIGETFAKTRYFLYIVTLLQNYRYETLNGTTKDGCDPRNLDVFDTKLLLRPNPFMVRAVQR